MSTPSSLFDNGVAAFSHLPIELLQAELARRQEEQGGNSATPTPTATPKPECGTKGAQAEYNVGSHVFALILILVLSTSSCAFPIIARRFPKLPIPHHFLFLSRHFGTGVLIATAFVHLLPTAFLSLSDPCLDGIWKSYMAMPGLICMLAVFAVVGIEMFFSQQGAGHVHGSDFDQIPTEPEVPGGGEVGFGMNGHAGSRKLGRPSRPRAYSEQSLGLYDDHENDVGMVNEMDKLPGEADEIHESVVNSNGHAKLPTSGVDDDSDDDLELDLDELADPNPSNEDDADLLAGRSRRRPDHRRNTSMMSGHTAASEPKPSTQLAQRLLLQCALLEAGILFHSVFIGMAVSVSRGPAFAVLLVAIAFHQTFEGLALGSRISALVPLLPPGSPKPWFMTLAFGTTTPIGQAIGLSIHTLYDPRSEVGLILVGCTNAISSGLLLFAGLVQLLAEDFLSESSYKSLRGKRRWEACGCVILGSFLMALIGVWA